MVHCFPLGLLQGYRPSASDLKVYGICVQINQNTPEEVNVIVNVIVQPQAVISSTRSHAIKHEIIRFAHATLRQASTGVAICMIRVDSWVAITFQNS